MQGYNIISDTLSSIVTLVLTLDYIQITTTLVNNLFYCYLPGYTGATYPRCDSSKIRAGRGTGAVPGRGPLEGYVGTVYHHIMKRGYGRSFMKELYIADRGKSSNC